MAQKLEQADGKSKHHGCYHWWLKRWKTRKERRAARREPECVPGYNRYRGWEL